MNEGDQNDTCQPVPDRLILVARNQAGDEDEQIPKNQKKPGSRKKTIRKKNDAATGGRIYSTQYKGKIVVGAVDFQ